MTILKIITVFLAIIFITFSIPTLMSTDLVSSTATISQTLLTFKFGFFKFSVEAPELERIYFDYSDFGSFFSGAVNLGSSAATGDGSSLRRLKRSGLDTSSSTSISDPITSKSYTSFGLLITANILIAVLIFIFWFEIFFLKTLVAFLLLSMAIFTITAFSLLMALLQPVQDFTTILVQSGSVSSTKIDSGAAMFIAVFIVGLVFTLSSILFMRQKGVFSESSYYIHTN